MFYLLKLPPRARRIRQINKGVFTAEVVIAIARGYGESPVKALVTTGYITAKEAIGINETSAAQLLTDRQLIQELARRVSSKDDIWKESFNSVVQQNTPSPDNGWQYEKMAATDDSPDEPMPGDDDYHDGP